MTSCSVTLNERPVRLLWISDARRADSTLASRLLSLRLEAAIYALHRRQRETREESRGDKPFLILLMSSLCFDSLCRRNCSCGRHSSGLR
jgi:hypothetical protein